MGHVLKFLLLFLLLMEVVLAQPSEGINTDKDLKNRTSVSLTWAPINLVHEYTNIRTGIHLNFKQVGLLTDLEIGLKGYQNWLENKDGLDYEYFGLRQELRLYSPKNESPLLGQYLSLELAYSHTERQLEGVDFRPKEEALNLLASADFIRNRYSFLFKLGKVSSIGKRFYFDKFIGVGLVYRDIEYRNAIYEEIATSTLETSGPGIFGTRYLDREGERWLPDMSVGFRIGYIFW